MYNTGAVVLDEISISPDLTFSAEDLQFKGFPENYGTEHCKENQDDSGDANHSDPNNTLDTSLADNALVLMFRPFRASWIQPFSVFSAKNAVNGDDLYKITREAVTVLENIGGKSGMYR